jgi:hypothetical protein
MGPQYPNVTPFMGGSNKWDALASSPYGLVFLVVMIVIAMFMAGAIMLVWGLLAFLGTLLIFMALLLILLNRGHTHISWMFLVAVALGVVFIVLSMVGVDEGMQINLRFIPGMELWNGIFH